MLWAVRYARLFAPVFAIEVSRYKGLPSTRNPAEARDYFTLLSIGLTMATDLAKHHQPVGDLLSGMIDSSSGGDIRLSEEQVASFHLNGFLAGVRLLDDGQVDQLREELDELLMPESQQSELWHEYHRNESADPDKVLFHALGAWRIKAGFHDLPWNPRFCLPASQLLGGPVRFWHDQLFCKPPRHGGVVAWHQDYSYWTRTKPLAHLTCWIALDDADEDNGCVCYVPGSHRWDLLPVTGLAGDMDAIREVLSDEQWQQFQSPVAAPVKRGQCTFHHGLTIHGSFENRTDRPRRATVLNVLRDGVCSASDEPLLAGIPVIRPGEKIQGPFFPLLFDGRLGN